MSRPLAILCSLLACALLLLGCGDGEAGAPAMGPPLERHDPQAVLALVEVEALRARVQAASSLHALGRGEDAVAHLAAAEAAWERLAPRVAAEDRALAREVGFAIDSAQEGIAAGALPEQVRRERLTPLIDQLLGGVASVLAPAPVREDLGVQALVARELDARLGREYRRAARAPGEDAGRRSFQHAFGLLERTRTTARGLRGAIGPEDDVLESLLAIRENAFPLGIVVPPVLRPVPEVQRALDRVDAALERRFQLGPPLTGGG